MRRKKRLPGRPATGKNTMIAIRWQKPLLDGIEKYAQQQMLDRGTALRQIVTRFLAEKGFIDPSEVYAIAISKRQAAE